MKPAAPSRRKFLQWSALGTFGAAFTSLLHDRVFGGESRSSGKSLMSKSLILIWLDGAPATIDMWDMKPDAPDLVRGEFQPISTSVPGAVICEHLPKLARVLDRCTLVRSLQHAIPAHGPGSQYVLTGNKPSGAVEYPSLGALAANRLAGEAPIPPYVAFGKSNYSGGGYLGGTFDPLVVSGGDSTSRGSSGGDASPRELDGLQLPEGMTAEDLSRRAGLRAVFDAGFAAAADPLAKSLAVMQRRGVDLLRADRLRKAFDLSDDESLLAYGKTEPGRQLLIARRLVERGARCVLVPYSGWDTHQNNFATLRGRLLPTLDRVVAALIADLDERSLLDETVVCCLGEFGRTPEVNRNAGRDHWSRAFSALLAGGGLKRGFVYGETDAAGREPTRGACSPADLAATLLTLLGVDTTERLRSVSGRPMTMFAEGKVIRPLLA